MITINEVQQMIEKLEAAGELSMKEEKYLALAKAFKQQASENVAMRKTLGEVVYSSEEVEHDGCLTFVVNPDYVHDAADLLDGETPTTDRIVAGIKADGVEEFLKGSQLPYQIATVLADYDNADDETLLHVIWSGQPPEPEWDVWHLEYVSRGNAIVREVLKQLRDGADK